MAVSAIENGVEIVHPVNPQTKVKILSFGANILSWTVNGEEKLWLSESAKLDGSKAVRGGIPLVFPRFGPPGKHAPTDKLPQHGFARSVNWELLGQIDDTTVQYGLGPEALSEEERSAWPFDFTLQFTVALGEDTLNLSLDVVNTDKKPFEFNVLFHSYFAIPDVSKVRVAGLSGLGFWNKVTTSQVPEDTQKEITFTGETDRVYADAPASIDVKFDGKTFVTAESKNLKDVVVWNPWSKGAESMSDFSPDDGYKKMICVENGSVAEFETLEPSATWQGSVTLKAHM